MPGTGKTATVKEVLRGLHEQASMEELPAFEEVWINALALSTPHQLYSTLWYALTSRNAAPARAAQLLEGRFSSPSTRRRPVIVVVDELDCLVTRKQTVLYNLLDWPSRRHARLVVVGIANTMDLPERMLPRVHSRLGLARAVFQPYTRDQIREIVTDRLSGLGVFRGDAVEMASRKVAALSGDVRRALHICRRAAELAEARYSADEAGTSAPAAATSSSSSAASASASADSATAELQLVQIADVQTAARELSATRHVSALKALPLLEKIAMVAVFLQLRASGSMACPLQGVFRRASSLLRSHLGWSGSRLPTMDEVGEMVARLGDQRLLLLDRTRGRWPVVRLGLQADDVPFALREESAISPMLD
jgi:origin recognition complex subunit 1